jgi:hypothetical protein
MLTLNLVLDDKAVNGLECHKIVSSEDIVRVNYRWVEVMSKWNLIRTF